MIMTINCEYNFNKLPKSLQGKITKQFNKYR